MCILNTTDAFDFGASGARNLMTVTIRIQNGTDAFDFGTSGVQILLTGTICIRWTIHAIHWLWGIGSSKPYNCHNLNSQNIRCLGLWGIGCSTPYSRHNLHSQSNRCLWLWGIGCLRLRAVTNRTVSIFQDSKSNLELFNICQYLVSDIELFNIWIWGPKYWIAHPVHVRGLSHTNALNFGASDVQTPRTVAQPC